MNDTIAMWASTKTALVVAITLVLFAIALATFTNWDESISPTGDNLLQNYHACNAAGVNCVTVR